jgi:hypothetical protein
MSDTGGNRSGAPPAASKACHPTSTRFSVLPGERAGEPETCPTEIWSGGKQRHMLDKFLLCRASTEVVGEDDERACFVRRVQGVPDSQDAPFTVDPNRPEDARGRAVLPGTLG